MLNEFIEKAKDVTDAAGKKTDEIYRLSKLKYTAARINSSIKERYEYLGNRVYEMVKCRKEDPDELMEITDEIDNLYSQLELTQAKIQALKKLITCPMCGAKNKITATYCNNCGTKLVTTDETFDDESFDSEIK